ncbi:MAG: hypothetical protein ACOYMB_01950 [Patescibacteria group bacterium]
MINSSQTLQCVLDAIIRKYDPENNVLSFVFINGTTGRILSPGIAALTSRTGDHNEIDILYVTNPSRLDDYQAPLAALQILGNTKIGNMINFYYPESPSAELLEIIILIKQTLKSLGEGWVHQLNWLPR